MILSAVMSHPFFVGVIAGSLFNLVLTPQTHQNPHLISMSWSPIWKRKPPDPVITRKVDLHVSCTNDDEDPVVCDVNASCVYSVSRRETSTHKQGALVDRGANGGLAGSDVRALCTTDRQVDVQGIDNHQLTNTLIVTAAGVVDT